MPRAKFLKRGHPRLRPLCKAGACTGKVLKHGMCARCDARWQYSIEVNRRKHAAACAKWRAGQVNASEWRQALRRKHKLAVGQACKARLRAGIKPRPYRRIQVAQ